MPDRPLSGAGGSANPASDREVQVQTPGEVAWDQEEDGYTTLPVRLYEIPEWRGIGQEKWMEIYVPGTDRWRRVKRHWEPVLEGLIDGCTLAECEERLAEARPDFNRASRRHIVRKVVRNLERAGMAELVLPQPPDVFDGRYERVRMLGRGGMGIVWLCQDRKRDGSPQVAVKHAWNWKTSFEKAQRSVQQEAEHLSRFDHERIARLVDTFEVDGRFHMVREFLDGEPLANLCGDPAFTEDRRILAVRQIAEALELIRGEGLFYFDLSPDNFYVEPGDRGVVVGDLGVCREIEADGIEVSSRIGTRRYAAPEMIGGGRATERSQVYALGRLYWHMVMGRIPAARSSVENVRRQNRAILELLKEEGASEAEVAFFDRACRMDPNQRPATLQEAVEILESGEVDP